MFDDVQQLLKAQAPDRRSPTNQADGHLLTGILYDETGEKLRAVHANKKGVRYPLLCVQGARREPEEECRWLAIAGKRS